MTAAHTAIANPADPRHWQEVDAAYQQLLRDVQRSEPHPWLLVQTLATTVSRRVLYGALSLEPGWRLLDVGTGFGPVAVEAAGAFGCLAVGVDVDVDVLARTARVRDALRGSTWLADPPGGRPTSGNTEMAAPGASASDVAGDVVLTAGDARQLPFADEAFDAVTARFVLQHLPSPTTTAAELVRVVRPGGVVCVVEADDGLSLTYPEPPAVVRRLQDAYVAAQHARGGDRFMGRKVASLLDDVGVEVTSVLVMPQAGYGVVPPSSLGRCLLHDRLAAVADEIVMLGLLGYDEVRDGLEAIATSDFGAQTAVDGHLAVIGRRR